MKANADKIIKRFEVLKTARADWPARWQQCADYVLPRFGEHNKRADRIFDSTAPLAVERFAASMESFLTPRARKWHDFITGDPLLDQRQDVRLFLEQLRDAVFRARYMPEANFANQMLEAYLSLGLYGTAVIFIDDDIGRGLRYQCIPVYECYLAESSAGRVDTVFRRYKLTARQAREEFGDDLPENIRRDADNPSRLDTEHEFLHAVYPRRDLQPGLKTAENLPVASVHVALAMRKVVREKGFRVMPYAVSRFSVTPNEVYGRSPAMMVMADILQVNAMAKTMLRAAEKMVNPPLLTPEDDILAGFNLKAGAINPGGLDDQGRQRVVPLQINGNLPIGLEMIEQRRKVINEAFYINLFQILVESPQKTATEVVERAQEKAQLIAPAMGRQQSEMLRVIIEREVDILTMARVFERIEMPDVLRELGGAMIMPKYETTMAKALEADDGVAIMQAVQGVAGLAQLDPSAINAINATRAAVDLCRALGVSARAIRTEEEIAALEQQKQKQEQAMALMQQAQMAIGGLQGVANAEKSLSQSQALAGGMNREAA